jgi:hypothetical protein
MAEYNTSLTSRVVSALQNFTSLANTMLKNGEGVEAWTATRWEDYVMVCLIKSISVLMLMLRFY